MSLLFSLHGINLEKIEAKYGMTQSKLIDPERKSKKGNLDYTGKNVPTNATKISDLDTSKKHSDVISFLDESKNLRKCCIAKVDLSSGGANYKCYWCKQNIPQGAIPLGCPIKYVPSRAIKTYHSEINKEVYTITENITENRKRTVSQGGNMSVENRGYYESDGIFCSFNCTLAFIIAPENRRNHLYKFSENLLMEIYNEVTDGKGGEIIPAPHWRLLREFGGNLDVDKFRESFNKINYIDHGNLSFISIGRLFEDQYKF